MKNTPSYSQNSLRIFGYIWGLIFLFIGLKSSQIFYHLIALFFLGIATFFPRFFALTKIYQLWIIFGDKVGAVNSKIIVFILFFGIFTPIGFLLKIFKKDLLNKKIDKNLSTYLKPRPQQNSDMRNQF